MAELGGIAILALVGREKDFFLWFLLLVMEC